MTNDEFINQIISALVGMAVIISLFAFCSCQHKPEPVKPPSAPIIAQATNPAPAIAQVNRSVSRVEDKVESTAAKVEAVEAKADRLLEEAIRSQNASMETAMRPLRDEIRALRQESDKAREQARNASEDIVSLDATLKSTAVERDAAVTERENMRRKAETDAAAYEARVSYATGERDRAEQSLKWWRTRALATWGVLGVLVAAFIAWKVYRPL
jgi:TolA-binding protein